MAQEVIGLACLADETLIHIFKYLPTYDVISLSTVCRRFHSLCTDRTVVRFSYFQRCFQLTEPILKTYLKPKIVFNNIEVLNLNYCSWLPASTFGLVGKLKNLKELHVLDCQVSFSVMQRILATHRFTALSWTWCSAASVKNRPNTNTIFSSLKEYLSDLRRLVVHISNIIFLIEIDTFIRVCSSLEELEIYNLYVPTNDRPPAHSTLRSNYGRSHELFPTVQKLRLLKCQDLYKERVNGGLEVIRHFINSFANADVSQWDELWITQTGSEFLYDWWQTELLSMDALSSASALNLSGFWPAKPTLHPLNPRDALDWRSLFVNYQENRPEVYEFVLRLLNHRERLKCRKLALNESGLTPELLCTVARQCPNVEELYISKCLVLNHAYYGDSGTPISIVEAFNRVCRNCLKLTHLNLTKTEMGVDFSVFANLKHLTSLGISTWMLTPGFNMGFPRECSKEWPLDLLQNCRNQMEVKEEQLKRTRMWKLAEACPQLTRLAVIDLRMSSRSGGYDFIVFEAEYACISQFKHLQHLWIQDPGYLARGAFLVHVLKGCTDLATLRLKNVGMMQTCVYVPQLTSALMFAKSLESLSILQTKVHLPATFYDSLSQCKKLERVRFSLIDEDADTRNRIFTLVEHLPKLNWLQVIMRSSIASCKALREQLNGVAKGRPCFKFFIENEGKHIRSYKESVPYVYLDGFCCMNG